MHHLFQFLLKLDLPYKSKRGSMSRKNCLFPDRYKEKDLLLSGVHSYLNKNHYQYKLELLQIVRKLQKQENLCYNNV